MKISKEVRLLQNKWGARTGWPQRLEWIELEGIRGWAGQRIEFNAPIVAICGENGSGKSTILQAAAVVYYQNKDQTDTFAGDVFPSTPWESLQGAKLRYSVRQGNNPAKAGEIRRVSDRWVGYKDRPQRDVLYKDLGRLQPLITRTGYFNVAKTASKETESADFQAEVINRMTTIMGRTYSQGRIATTDADSTRRVPILSQGGSEFSGFHQGAGELTVEELLRVQPNKNSLLLIDEIETSLHPRAQRRLIHDLADMARQREVQIILTTHSPYILEELPPDARSYILLAGGRREIISGVSPEFAMSKMDDEFYPEGDLYVEDELSRVWLTEILAEHAREINGKIEIIPYGAAGVGASLGQMAKAGRFKRPTVIFLDGDQPSADGCWILPGGDAPERVVFDSLRAKNWALLDMRLNRSHTEIVDACTRAMTGADHHTWPASAAKELQLGSDVLWQALCSVWAADCLSESDAEKFIKPIREELLLKQR